MKEVSIYFIRHGETIFNRKNYIQGQCDGPLTPEGIQGATNLGKYLKDTKFDIAYSSDLRRTRETRELILNENEYETPMVDHAGFREYGFGEYEGDDGTTFWKDLGDRNGVDIDEVTNGKFLPKYDYVYDEKLNPTAELRKDFEKRLIDGIHEIGQKGLADGHENIMLVAHGITLHAVLELFIEGIEFEGFIANTSITKFIYDGENLKLEYVGKTV